MSAIEVVVAAVHPQLHEMLGRGHRGVEGAVLRRLERLRLELHHHARRAVDEQGDPPPGIRRLFAREGRVRIGQRDGEKRHAQQEDEKRRVAERREVRAEEHRQHGGQRHVRAAGLLRAQPAREQHQARDRQKDHQHQDGDPRLVEVEISPGQTKPVAQRVLDHRDQLSQRDHTMPPTSAAVFASAPAVRIGHRFATRSFFRASVPCSNAASSEAVSSWPLRP